MASLQDPTSQFLRLFQNIGGHYSKDRIAKLEGKTMRGGSGLQDGRSASNHQGAED